MSNRKRNDDDWDEVGLSIDEPMEEPVFIDIEGISNDARTDSYCMVQDLAKIYGNKTFMDEHPDYKKRLDIELENLRVLIKMRKSDEVTHDVLVKAISQNSTNASLYQSLTKVQSTLLSIQKQMDETIKTLNGLLKNYQLELNFEPQEEEVEINLQGGTSMIVRGRRDLCKQLTGEDTSDLILESPSSK